MKITDGLQFAGLKVLQRILLLIPRSWVSVLAERIGRFVFLRLNFRRDITLENIRNAFPELSPREHLGIAVSSYASVAVTLFEFMLFKSMTEDDLSSLVRISNPELLQSAKEEGKGILLLTAHYGSWELFAQAAGRLAGSDGSILMKVQSNPPIAREVDEWRTHFGLRTVATAVGVRDTIRTLHAGGWVALAADQAAPRESIAVQFFGRDVPTYQGPAVFALRTGAPLLFGLAHRESDGTYRITLERIQHDDLDGDDDENIRILTNRHVMATERSIRKDPGQWMWMHRRWKHVPSEEAGR